MAKKSAEAVTGPCSICSLLNQDGRFRSKGSEAVYRAQLSAQKAGWFNTIYNSAMCIYLVCALRHYDLAATTWSNALSATFSLDFWMEQWRLLLICALTCLARAACIRSTSCTAVVLITTLLEAFGKALLLFTPGTMDCLEPLQAFLANEGRLHEVMAGVFPGSLSRVPAALTTIFSGCVFFMGAPLTGRQQVPCVLLRDVLHLAVVLGSERRPAGGAVSIAFFLAGVMVKIMMCNLVDLTRRKAFLKAAVRAKNPLCYKSNDEDEAPSCRSPQPQWQDPAACCAVGSGDSGQAGQDVACRLTAPADHLLLPAAVQTPAAAAAPATKTLEVMDTREQQGCCPTAVPQPPEPSAKLFLPVRVKTYEPYRTSLEHLSVVFMGHGLSPICVWRARLPALLRILNSRYPAHSPAWSICGLSIRSNPLSVSARPSRIAELNFVRTATTLPTCEMPALGPTKVCGSGAAVGTLKVLGLEAWLDCQQVDQAAGPGRGGDDGSSGAPKATLEVPVVRVQVGEELGVFVLNVETRSWAPAVARALPRNVTTLPSLHPRCVALPQRMVRFCASFESAAMLDWISRSGGPLRVEAVLHRQHLPVQVVCGAAAPQLLDVDVDLSCAVPGLLRIHVWCGKRLLATEPVLLLCEGRADAAAELDSLCSGSVLVRKLAGLVAICAAPAEAAREGAAGRRSGVLLPAVIAAAALLAEEPELCECPGTQALIQSCIGQLKTCVSEAAVAIALTGFGPGQ